MEIQSVNLFPLKREAPEHRSDTHAQMFLNALQHTYEIWGVSLQFPELCHLEYFNQVLPRIKPKHKLQITKLKQGQKFNIWKVF